MATIHDKLKNPQGNIFLHELLKEASRTTDKSEKINLLQKYSKRDQRHHVALRYFVEGTYHPAVVFDLPDGSPKYRPLDAADETMAYTTLFKELSKIKYFCKGSAAFIQRQEKRELMFVQLLEQLCPHEAKLLLMVKDKKLDKRIYPMLGEDTFREAFPDWFPKVEETEEKNA